MSLTNELSPHAIDFQEGVYICGYCGRTFPTHYWVKKDFWERKQYARQYVAGINNFERHARACERKEQ